MIHRFRIHQPEVVLTMSAAMGVPAMLAASLVGVPRVVVTARGEGPPAGGTRADLFKAAFQAALARKRISLATNSSAAARKYADWLEQPSDRIRVIDNGLDADALQSERNPAVTAEHRRRLAIPDGARIVGSVFNSRQVKRPGLWMAAAALLARRAPDVVFVIVGGRFDGDETATTLRRHGLDDRFHLPGVRRDVPAWLNLMDVVLLTSEAEGTPNVLLEAQALGRPVVATAVGGTAETFLPGQTGILLPADPTPEEVADAVMRVLDDPGFSIRAREQGPGFIQGRFCVRRMASEFVDLCFGPHPRHSA